MLTRRRIKHRDWYIDEGASNPVFGAVASISGALTNAVVAMSKYTKDIHQTVRKKPGEKSTPTSATLEPDSEALEWTLTNLPTRTPVTNAAAYPPQHLEVLAYRMASKTLPDKKHRSKHRKTHSWSPVQRPPTAKATASKVSKKHGRLHEASSETRHVTASLLATGCKGMLFHFLLLKVEFRADEMVRKHQ